MTRNRADQAGADPARAGEGRKGLDAAQERVERPEAFDIRIDVDAAVEREHVEADEVRDLGGVPRAAQRLFRNGQLLQVGVRPGAVLPVGMEPFPALGEEAMLLGQRLCSDPDAMEHAGDPLPS